jgi:hypothetical protein
MQIAIAMGNAGKLALSRYANLTVEASVSAYCPLALLVHSACRCYCYSNSNKQQADNKTKQQKKRRKKREERTKNRKAN